METAPYAVDLASPVPPSRQLVEAVLDGIAAGTLEPGDRLLSVRAMASEALVNPNTVAKAYRDLEALGVVVGRNGRGVYVTDEGPAIAAKARRQATLAAFARALHEALRAGHSIDELRRMLLENRDDA
jgi:GntR family transcriptional regulator